MMENIKLKAWDNDRKQMAKVVALDWGANDVIVSCHLQYADGSVEKRYPMKDYGDDIEFLLYADLKDKNNKEIYNGDIIHVLEVSNTETIEFISPVKWDESGFIVTRSTDDCEYPLCCFHNLENTYPLFEIELLGNIYENPDLVKNLTLAGESL